MTKKSFYLAISFITVFAVAVLVFIFVPKGNGTVEADLAKGVSISESDVLASSNLAKDFLLQAGEFGVRVDEINSDNVSTVMASLLSGETDFQVTREDVYKYVHSSFVDNTGSFKSNSESVAKGDVIDRNFVANFSVRELDVEETNVAKRVLVDNNKSRLTVNIGFTGKSNVSYLYDKALLDKELTKGQTEGAPSESHGEDSHIWNLLEQEVEFNGTLTLSKDETVKGSSWKVNSIVFDKGEFLFPFWNPGVAGEYPDFVRSNGVIVNEIVFPNEMPI